MTSSNLVGILVGLFSISLTSFAPAASAMGRASGPCEPAMDQYCGGILELGHGELIKCLKDHEAELPAECKAVLDSQSKK
jgi:hypothetical protein